MDGWVAFKPMHGQVKAMSDLALLQTEINPVMMKFDLERTDDVFASDTALRPQVNLSEEGLSDISLGTFRHTTFSTKKASARWASNTPHAAGRCGAVSRCGAVRRCGGCGPPRLRSRRVQSLQSLRGLFRLQLRGAWRWKDSISGCGGS